MLPSSKLPASHSPHRSMDSASGSGLEETERETFVESDEEVKDITTTNLESDSKTFPGGRNSERSVGEEVEEVEKVNSDVEVKVKRKKDLNYFLEMVVFKVEQTLFRVPAQQFRLSTNFFDERLDEIAATSSENDKVIELDDVSISDFRALLRLFYPLTIQRTKTLTYAEWISVLQVSTKWNMFEIRRIATEQLTSAFREMEQGF